MFLLKSNITIFVTGNILLFGTIARIILNKINIIYLSVTYIMKNANFVNFILEEMLRIKYVVGTYLYQSLITDNISSKFGILLIKSNFEMSIFIYLQYNKLISGFSRKLIQYLFTSNCMSFHC